MNHREKSITYDFYHPSDTIPNFLDFRSSYSIYLIHSEQGLKRKIQLIINKTTLLQNNNNNNNNDYNDNNNFSLLLYNT